jgi:hypothetical protein
MTRASAHRLLVGCLLGLCCVVYAQDRPSYPWEMPLDQVAKFTSLTYQSGAIKVTFGEGHCAPIVAKVPGADGQPQAQVTGLEVLATGKAQVSKDGVVLYEDEVYAGMFRFHPDDREAFVVMEGKEPAPSAGVRRMLLDLCYGGFARFWHRRMEAMIPDRGVAAVYVYAKERGGVMLWQTARELAGFDTETKAELFKK